MKYVPNAITRVVGRTALRAQKNSPTILFVVGVTSAVGATVLACRATLKAQPAIDHWKKDLIDLEMHASRSKSLNETDYKRDLAHMHFENVYHITKLYAPAIAVGTVSIFCLTQSHRQLTQRNAALTTAYVGLQTFLEGYRGRVREAIGEEKERDVYYAATPVELVEDDGKNGTRKVYGSAPGMMSPYSVYFDSNNLNWQDSAEYNIHYIRLQEDQCTNQLRAQGHLFLNEVYDRLGIERSAQGQAAGWFIGHNQSDDFVEIKIDRIHDLEGSLMLDFNIAGNVMHMLDDNKKRYLPSRRGR